MTQSIERTPRPWVIALLESDGSNPSGDEWSWTAHLKRRKDGRYSLTFSQRVRYPPAQRAAGLIGFREAAQMVDFLDDSWREFTGKQLSERQWREVASRLAAQDKAFSDAVQLAARTLLQREDRIETPLRRAVDGATWPQKWWDDGGRTGRAAAAFYAERYLVKHGFLPTGVHRVQVNVGGPDGDIPPRSVTQVGGELLDVQITFPVII